jgi:hypothetical protein
MRETHETRISAERVARRENTIRHRLCAPTAVGSAVRLGSGAPREDYAAVLRRQFVPVTTSSGAFPMLAALVLVAVWLLTDPRTADLAAAVYRSQLFARDGLALWDNAWFGGHHLPGYSLLSPALGSMLGPRIAGALAVLSSAVLFSVLAQRHAENHARLASVWFAVAAAGDLFIGRLSFALGVTCGLAALTAWSYQRPRASYVLSALTSAANPVAGLFLTMVAVGAIPSLGRRQGVAMAASALSVAGLMAAVFPEGGRQPYDLAAALAALAVCTLVTISVDARFASVRRTALLYLLAIALAYVLPTPMGSNVARFGVLLAGPVMLCTARADRRWLLYVSSAGLVAWTLWAPVSEVAKSTRSEATTKAYFRPLEQFLARAGAERGRVEVIPTSTRWESVYLSRRFALARGWETQLDYRHNRLFYRQRLDPEKYRDWLHHNGVRFVALPDAPLERWGTAEARLVTRRPSWLTLVWRNTHWRVFAVRDATSMISGPMRLQALGSDGFSVQAMRRGRAVLRVHFTPFWSSSGPGCVSAARDGWTVIHARRPGTIEVRASWRSGGLLRRPDCAGEVL